MKRGKLLIPHIPGGLGKGERWSVQYIGQGLTDFHGVKKKYLPG